MNNIDSSNKYTKMQFEHYEEQANLWDINNLDPVVGSFIQHNNWDDYNYLFKDIDDLKEKTVLDFGCGPGRNIVKYNDQFKNIDGVDISKINLEKAKIWMEYNNINQNNLYLCNGVDLNIINDEQYDIIMSTICFQHICVYTIRYNYLKEFYRILKPNGYITIQMGYGGISTTKNSVDYYDDNYDAITTNGGCDTRVNNYEEIEKDLTNIGFKNFKYYIRPVGPGDDHPNWIFFSAQK